MAKVVAVIEVGDPAADGLASLFILLGYGALPVSSRLHRHGYRGKVFPDVHGHQARLGVP
jgi:hypothetical protein